MTNEIQKRAYELDKPLQMAKMANLVKSYVVKNNLYVPIVGKNYVMVEGWQFAGGMMGLFPRVVKVENIGTMKWMAQVEIVNSKTKEVLSSGFAICSKEENKKASFDEYAILSMAQTRAIGKAYRNLIGWVMKLAGYESTPAEEIKGQVQVKTAAEGQTERENGVKIAELKRMLKGETEIAKLADLKKRSGMVLASFKITEKHAGILIAALLQGEVK